MSCLCIAVGAAVVILDHFSFTKHRAALMKLFEIFGIKMPASGNDLG